MRLSLRFVLPLGLVLIAIAYAVVPLVDQLTLRWFVRDLDIRSALIADTLQEPLKEQLAAGKRDKITSFFARITQDERPAASHSRPHSRAQSGFASVRLRTEKTRLAS